MMSTFIDEIYAHLSNKKDSTNPLQIQDLESIVHAMENSKDNQTALDTSGITEDLMARFNNADEYANFVTHQNLTEVHSLLKKISDLTTDFRKQNPGTTASTDSQIVEKILNSTHQFTLFITQMLTNEHNNNPDGSEVIMHIG